MTTVTQVSQTTKKTWRMILTITVVAGFIGFAYATMRMSFGLMPQTAMEMEHAIRTSTFLGFLMAVFLYYVVYAERGSVFRRLGFVAGWALIDVVSSLIIVAGILTQRLITSLVYYGDVSYLTTYFDDTLIFDAVLAFLVFLVFAFVLQMRRLVGEGTMWKMLTGRYHRPRQEDRIFMFLDIKDSTSLAERLGDEKTHALITDVFFDADRIISEHLGEILSYNGDELVASWPEEVGLKNGRCLACYDAIVQRLAEKTEHYTSRYGTVPELWAGLHRGPVVVGECGDSRLAIVHIGDTPNTAARLEHKAKELGRDCLVSGTLMEAIELPATLTKTAMGKVTLRGHTHETEIFAIAPQAVG